MATLPAIKGKSVPAILLICLIPAPDRIIVEIEKFGNLNAGLAFVQKQNCIRSTCNSMIFALTANAALKLKSFFESSRTRCISGNLKPSWLAQDWKHCHVFLAID